jgi:glyoxylase I family protein
MAMKVDSVTTLLQVFDMPRSVAFYRDVLGFEVVTTSARHSGERFDWGLLRLGGVHLMLNTAYEAPDRPPAPDPARVRSHGDTSLFFGCPDLDGAYRHLRAKGLDVSEPVVRNYGMRQLSLKDPDGYDLCFQTPVA